MVFIAWLGIIINRLVPNVISSSFWLFLILFGGLAIFGSYAILKVAHPLVDTRFKKHGQIFGLFSFLWSLLMIVMTVTDIVEGGLDLKEFFSHGGSGSMLMLGISLFAVGSSILYRHYLNKREEKES